MRFLNCSASRSNFPDLRMQKDGPCRRAFTRRLFILRFEGSSKVLGLFAYLLDEVGGGFTYVLLLVSTFSLRIHES